MRHSLRIPVLALAAVTTLAGCEKKEEESSAAAKTAAAAPTPTPTPTPAPPPKEEEPEEKKRPADIDTELTDEKRAKVEEAYPKAKGFVVMTEIEDTLKKNKAIDNESAALATFDKMAKGKWVLFTGPMVNLTDEGFDIGVTYTPKQPNDPMGMSRQWFPLTLTGIEGYEKDAFKAGDKVVVLAKYTGDKKATEGYELVAVEHW